MVEMPFIMSLPVLYSGFFGFLCDEAWENWTLQQGGGVGVGRN